MLIGILFGTFTAFVLPRSAPLRPPRVQNIVASDSGVTVSVRPAGNGGNANDEQMAELIAMRNQQLAQQVENLLAEFPKTLAPGVAPPAALDKLQQALDTKDVSAMFLGIYEVLNQRALSISVSVSVCVF